MTAEEARTHWVRYLEMTERPPSAGREAPAAEREGFEIRLAEPVDVPVYRRVYREVGDPWRWFVRRRLDDDALEYLLGNPLHELWYLWEGAAIAGFAELDLRQLPDVELVYFGLKPGWIGRGLGRWFLERMIAHAFSRQVGRLWLHTCELDHPRALDLYRSAGFRVVREEHHPLPAADERYLW